MLHLKVPNIWFLVQYLHHDNPKPSVLEMYDKLFLAPGLEAMLYYLIYFIKKIKYINLTIYIIKYIKNQITLIMTR